MNFTTLEIAELTGAGHEGPSCVVQRVAIDPGEVVGEDNLLFATSAHPPPLGDTSLRLEDEIAERVPYLTERPWVGGTAVIGPSTEAMLRSMAGDDRGRPAGALRVGVIATDAPWAMAELLRVALGGRTDTPVRPGPPDEREIPGTERFRVPLALLNHGPDQPLVVELNRRHRGCAGADAALLDPHVLVIGDLGPRQVAMMGTDGTLRQTEEVLAACGPDTHVVIPEGLQDDLDPWIAPRPRHTYRVGTNAAGETTLHLDVSGRTSSGALPTDASRRWLANAQGATLTACAALARTGPEVDDAVTAMSTRLTDATVHTLPDGVAAWDRSDATSVGAVIGAVAALAEHPADARYAILGPVDDGPTAAEGLHCSILDRAAAAGVVGIAAGGWGIGTDHLDHPVTMADELAAAGDGAVVVLAGTGADLLSVRDRLLSMAQPKS